MKLLIPTDFSQLSKIAIQYAIGLSKDIEIAMVILHVVDTHTPSMARLSSKKLAEVIKTSSEANMNELIKTIKKENKDLPKINSKIIYGAFIEKEVEAFALKNNIDMVCIGTKGATGLKKVLLGSNAAAIINNSSIPVLTIPEYARYKGVKNMVYSSDLLDLDEELKSIIPMAKSLKSWVHILHIEEKMEDFDENLLRQEKRLITQCSYKKIKIKQLQNASIVSGINKYVADVDADMVTMFTHTTNVFEKIFKKSVTQNTAFQTRTPLLTFQKRSDFYDKDNVLERKAMKKVRDVMDMTDAELLFPF